MIGNIMKNKILQKLASLDTASIALLTTDTIFERGDDYITRGCVKNFSWDSDDRLKSIVFGLAPYQVTISQVGKADFYYFCNCPAWNSNILCKHIICVLLKASALLSDKKSTKKLVSNTDLQLKKSLLADSSFRLDEQKNTDAQHELQDSIKINFSPAYSYRPFFWPHFLVFLTGKNGKIPSSALPKDSPYQRLFSIQTQSMMQESHLCNIIEHEQISDQVTIHTHKGPLEVDFYHECLVPKTDIDLTDNMLYVRCLIAQPDKGKKITEIIRIAERIIVDVANKRLAVVCKGMMWEWPERTLEALGNALRWGNSAITLLAEQVEFINAVTDNSIFPTISSPFPISIEQFNTALKLVYYADKKETFDQFFTFRESGQEVTPDYAIPQAMINATVDPDSRIIYLRPQAMVGQQHISTDSDLLNYLEKIDKTSSSWLRTKARRSLITKTIFSLIAADSEQDAEKIIDASTQAIRDGYQGNLRTVSFSEVRKYFQDFYYTFLSKSSHLLERIIVADQKIHKIAMNYAILWKSHQILSEFFQDSFSMDEGSSPSFNTSLTTFYNKFFELKELLDRHGIELQLNHKRIQSVKLDVSVDIRHTSSGEWFDLAPHILAEGIALSDEQRDLLFTSNGLIESADCIKILDPQSREIISILAKMLRPGDATLQQKAARTIVQIPRLRVLDLIELRQSGARVNFSAEDEQLVTRLSNFSKIEKIALPHQFVGTLREYQVSGYWWLAFLYRNRFGACLADDMGLGKTIQAIAFLAGIKEGIIQSQAKNITTPHLIVMPPTLLFNWKQELNKFYPSFRVREYTGGNLDSDFDGYDIILTTYDRVRLDSDYLTTIKFHTLILDEAQAIKNIHAGRTTAVRQLKSFFTISLTGTPLENHIGEYYSIFDVALPGLLPNYKTFMKLAAQNDSDFIKKTKPFVLRRTKDAILKDLPPKVESNIYLTMTEKQQKLYATTVKEVKRLIDNAYTTKTAAQANVIALTAILRLRQICISPQMVDAKKSDTSPKIDYLVSSLEEIVQEGNAALVFSQFTSCLDLIQDALIKANIKYYRIDGKTPIIQRKKIVESFQNNDQNTAVFLLSLKTGGVGLNLTRANYVFHVDPWWNPAVENQASDRSHRIGQKNSVFIKRLVMHHTIEEKMMLLKEEKQKLFQDVMEHAENKAKGMISKRDFDLLLS